jgi:hypothetical protein
MPIWEADPWRLQYFERVACPEGVDIPTEDYDAWVWNPKHRWIYDKLAVALSQDMRAAPHGVMPPVYPVFSKPITNLRGMGVGSRVLRSEDEYRASLCGGHFWEELCEGEHVSTDVAVEYGCPRWWRHTVGVPRGEGTFDRWIIAAEDRPELEAFLGTWIRRHLRGYTGMMNLETIGGRIIEAHLRFADQWVDLYGKGWCDALVRLYEHGQWQFADDDRRTGYSVVLFGPPGRRYRHPPHDLVEKLKVHAGISSVQITFHADKPPEQHAMPPGGFRLAVVNCYDLDAGYAARDILQDAIVGPSENSHATSHAVAH